MTPKGEGAVARKPKLSIITYVHVSDSNGRLPLLLECLESAASQGFEEYEHVVIDDGSTVDIEQTVRYFPKTRYVRKDRTGIVSSTETFNRALNEARGDYSVLLPSDDLALRGGYESLIKEIERGPYDAVIGAVKYSGRLVRKTWRPPSPEALSATVLHANGINGIGILWRTHWQFPLGLPRDLMGFAADYFAFAQLARFGKIGTLGAQVAEYRAVGDSTRFKTRNKTPQSTSKRLISSETDRYQYSRSSRLRFVRDSLRRHNMDRSPRQGAKLNLNLCDFAYVSESKKNRKLLERNSPRGMGNSSQSLKTAASEVHTNWMAGLEPQLAVSNPAEMALVNALPRPIDFQLIYDGEGDTWIFDHLPMNRVSGIVSTGGHRRKDMEAFLGLSCCQSS